MTRHATNGRIVALGWLLLGVLIGGPLAWVSCGSGPPKEPEDLCSIFREKRDWHRSAERSYEKWGVPPAVQLAIIHQESSFRSNARPPREQILWIFPGPRPSSAYGYGQVIDETWGDYKNSVDRASASRRNFSDVADFIGWYSHRIHLRTGIEKEDATELYAAYHEGPGGYLRGSHLSKAWLGRVAIRVGRRASRYQRQYEGCREELKRPRFWGLF
ncbi:MAG: transglycosylase SLT domain-containing protein [Myxococcota bacterium]|nr:transglycosylase SLT domain-containing protein [Myxococcota bacterium]